MTGPSSPTKERIVEEAMRLFGEQGYRGTSVKAIEAAAGLSPGAGGLYRHFASKEEVLAAGIARHLERLDALRDVRRVLSEKGDLGEELATVARYFLIELDSQTELLRILVSEKRQRPELLNEAVDELIASTYQAFAEWLHQVAEPTISPERAVTITTLALGSLLSSRLLRNVVGVETLSGEDEPMVTAWVDMVIALVHAPDSRNGQPARTD